VAVGKHKQEGGDLALAQLSNSAAELSKAWVVCTVGLQRRYQQQQWVSLSDSCSAAMSVTSYQQG